MIKLTKSRQFLYLEAIANYI